MSSPFVRRAVTRREDGAALLLMLLAVVIGAATLFVSSAISRTPDSRKLGGQAEVLADAKSALLAYAVTRYDFGQGIGLLPCPDVNAGGGFEEGVAHASACGAQHTSVIGRLPWKTLGLPPSRAHLGECLWYAVSGVHKDASGARAELINADTNGLLQLFGPDGASLITGSTPADRAVAMVFAPGGPLGGQTRADLGSGVDHCNGNFNTNSYLESNGTIDNRSLSGLPDAVDQFINGLDSASGVNDQILAITRSELAAAMARRADLAADLEGLTDAAARCLAAYGRSNPGGPLDLRLPWPAPVNLADYRSAGSYSDSATGVLSGRLPDTVDDSNLQTGNPLASILSDCDSAVVPQWTAATAALWADWKDHFFLAISDGFQPDAALPSACAGCLTVNGAGPYAAVLMFSGNRLTATGQVRNEPPTDADTKSDISNYLEGRNASNHPLIAGTADYEVQPASTVFNDLLVCLDTNLDVAAC